ncbi:hypothetical protein VW29_07455 [Devosia limi DSM 17137]|uniref:Uncharacterized protein n=1 Tax=Devosia limi DSM 17137 TaxID=1121477 RepID=A0A0F5LS93_9HYPH|nr:hypothetical protein [Devosia limi]KKB85161.1 hypothetical protein VW29_07455 [Devosia limi DSM 17137]SHF76944.1 hypothetical protein SAMN02745223_03503 [Devosia limi DSM 17137]
MSATKAIKKRVLRLQRALPKGETLTSISITPEERAQLEAESRETITFSIQDGVIVERFLGVPLKVDAK